MPPVLGPRVAVADPLEVLRRREGDGAGAVADREDGDLGPGHALLDDDRATRVAERRYRRSLARTSASASARSSVTSTPLPAARPSVLTTQGAGQRRRKAIAGLGLGEGAVTSRGHLRGRRSSFMYALEPSTWAPSAPGPNTSLPGRPQAVGQPVDERLLRADHEQVGVELLGRRGDRPGDAGVPRCHDDLRRPRQHVRQARLPPPRPPRRRTTSIRASRSTQVPGRRVRPHPPRASAPHSIRPAVHVLVASGTDAEEADRDADLLLEEGDVVVHRRAGGPGSVGSAQLLPHPGRSRTRAGAVEHRLVVGQVGDALSVDLVGDAHLDLVERVQDVELRDGELRQGVEAHGVPEHRRRRTSPAGGCGRCWCRTRGRVDDVVAASSRRRIALPDLAGMSSVGNGPAPTRVTYALATPTTRSMWRGPTPAPGHAPPAMGFDDVTNG